MGRVAILAGVLAGVAAVTGCADDRRPPPLPAPSARAPTAAPTAPPPTAAELAVVAELDTVLLTVDLGLHAIRLRGPGSPGHPARWPVHLTAAVVADADAALRALTLGADPDLAGAARAYQATLGQVVPRVRDLLTAEPPAWAVVDDQLAAITRAGGGLHAAAAARASARPTAAGDPGTVVAACGRVAGLAARLPTVPVTAEAPVAGRARDATTAAELTAAGLACLAAADRHAHLHPSGAGLVVADWGAMIASNLLHEAERFTARSPTITRLGAAAAQSTYLLAAARRPPPATP